MTTPTQPASVAPGKLEQHLRARRESGGKSLVTYVMAGITENWLDLIRAQIDAGADAVEVGLPFSDPMLDGPNVQAAATQALERGATVGGLVQELAEFDSPVPLVAMTYSNIVTRHGPQFCSRLADAGVSGLIVPDTPVDEVGPLRAQTVEAGLELVLLVAPSTRPDRVQRIAELGRGFVYAVSTMGTTGVRSSLSDTVSSTVARVRANTNLPVLVGFGVSTPAHAVAASEAADGAIVASALMQRVLDGAGPAELGAQVASFRTALDGMSG